MSIQRASLLMPSDRLEDLPLELRGPDAAEMLSAWTALWHPAVIAATDGLPGWHSVHQPPEPESLQDELVLIPPFCRERLPMDWIERIRSAGQPSGQIVFSQASRQDTVMEMLRAASLSDAIVPPELIADFLALGYAHLQVELLTRAMRYTTVLDASAFRAAVIGAARDAVAGNSAAARDQLVAAFDQLTDARNHFYAVDFYLVDTTLLAPTTLGETLRAKLATGVPTNLLATGQLLERLAVEQPETLAQLTQAIKGDSAVCLGGPMCGSSLSHREPEGMLAELRANRDVHLRLLSAAPAIYGQFGAAFSPLLPEILSGLGYHAALHTSFDGSRGDRPPQPKTRWGARDGPSVEILATTPLDIADPGTWLTLGERIGDTLMRDHVATLLFAGWPGHACEYYEDLRRIARIAPVLGRFVTIEEYFRLTAEVDDWSAFNPVLYPNESHGTTEANRISTRVDAYRQHVAATFDRLSTGLAELVGSVTGGKTEGVDRAGPIVLNPWSFSTPRYIHFDPLNFDIASVPQSEIRGTTVFDPEAQTRREIAEVYPQSEIAFLPDVSGLGYVDVANRAAAPSAPLASGHTLRNEFIEAVISETTGGIQSIRTHRDRSTRVSQRLVMHDRRLPQETLDADDVAHPARSNCRMAAERVDITRNDSVCGEIASHGRLTDVEGKPLAKYVQRARIVRGLPIVMMDVELDAELAPSGYLWHSYFASRLAWREEAVTVRCGVDRTSRETTRRRIETPEWVELSDIAGNMTCFACGLPFHRLAGPTWLDTLLQVDGESRQRFQLAIGLNCRYPVQTSLALLTAGWSNRGDVHHSLPSPAGWLLHVSAKNVIVTHLEFLSSGAGGVRLRLLETEGRAGPVRLTAFRPFAAARRTDFAGNVTDGLPIVDGSARVEIGAHRWLQIEAQW